MPASVLGGVHRGGLAPAVIGGQSSSSVPGARTHMTQPALGEALTRLQPARLHSAALRPAMPANPVQCQHGLKLCSWVVSMTRCSVIGGS